MRTCTICQGTLEYTGALGSNNVYKCRNCGMELLIKDISEVSEVDELCEQFECLQIDSNYKVEADTPEKKEAAFRWIIKNCQYLIIDGFVIDQWSASIVCQVLDKVTEKTKGRLLKLNCYQLIKYITSKL